MFSGAWISRRSMPCFSISGMHPPHAGTEFLGGKRLADFQSSLTNASPCSPISMLHSRNMDVKPNIPPI